jgi:LuxR family maltose regulon positive regulatory protein
MLRGPDGCRKVEGALMLRRALLAAGRPVPDLAAEAGAALRRAPLDTRVQHRLLLAAAEGPDSDDGRRQLERALQLAAPERLRRPFLDAPEDVRAVLAHLGRRGERSWLQVPPAPRASADDHAATPRPSPLVPGPRREAPANPLTPKEQEVLGYLADLLTTDEIASTMFVSVNTVRSHVRSILRKLGVTRRNEAVRRAWELRLLTPRGVA